jgi:hypothetical protein
MLMVSMVTATFVISYAGELKKDYFGATTPGTWAEYQLEASGGTKATSSSQRTADADGHVVLEETTKIQAGPGAGSESKNTLVMPQDFNLARDCLSYGKFTEKMTMKYGDMVMPADATTLEAIKKGAKDFRGAVTFEAVELVDGHTCDRYAYAVAIGGPGALKETGQLWLDASVPFGIVRQVAKSPNSDGSSASTFELKLLHTGKVQVDAPPAGPTPMARAPAAPSVVALVEAYQADRVAIEVAVEKDSGGRQLQLTFINKTETELTVQVAAGALSIPASDPIGALKIVVKKAANIIVPAGAAAEPIVVEQQPGRGALEGKFTLSVYEGTLLYSGSITRGTVTRAP